MSRQREAALPGGSPQHSLSCSPETVATPREPRTEAEEQELAALIAEQAAEEARCQREPTGQLVSCKYPPRPWQEVPHHDPRAAAFERSEREGQGWQLDLDAICDRLDREGGLSFEPEPDYWRMPESVSTRLSDPERIRQALSYVPLSPALIRAALRNKRYRTGVQRDMLGRLADFIVSKDIDLTALAGVIGCDRSTLTKMKGREGMTVMEKLDKIERQLERIERATRELKDERGLNPVKEAERILAEFEDELAA
jgi:DNA-binding Xre family transcriptional regulator